MFEKEAKEYLKKDGTKAEQIFNMLNEISPLKITSKQVPFILAMIQQTFQDGAEFGYYKANKWHRVADRDLPSEEGGWVCNQDGLPCYFDWSTEQWLDCEGTQIRTTEWCNMPHKENE